jgi:zinc protease
VRVAVIVLVALAGTAGAADELRLPPITRTTLDNGLRVIIAEYHELPLVETTMIVGAGAAQDPPGKDGLAALTAEMLTRGAGGLSAEALARAIESVGGRISATPGTDGTIVGAEFLASDFATGLDLLRRVLLEPRFARDEVRRARDEQEAGIVAALENTSEVAEKCYAALVYGGHPYGRPVEGRRTTVRKLGRGDVTDFYDRWYHPNDTILVLVGDFVAADALARVRDAFGSWRPRPDAVAIRAAPPVPFTGRRTLLVDKPDATQTQIRFGNVAIARNDPRYISATVANTLLGGGFTSILVEELRIKRSLTYGAWSGFAARRSGGDFRVGTFTKGATTGETVTLALRVEGDFRGQRPAAAALQKAKSYLEGQFPLKVESPDALAGRLAEVEFNGLPEDELVTYRTRVSRVTADEVGQVSQQLMPAPSDVAIVVVGKAAEIRDQLTSVLGPMRTVSPADCDDLGVRR